MGKRLFVAFAGAAAGVAIGLLIQYATGWNWAISVCSILGGIAALLIAEQKRLVRTRDELNRPTPLFPKDQP